MKKVLSLVLAFLLPFSFGTAEEVEVREGDKENAQVETIQPQSYADLAILGNNVWQVMGGEIRITDTRTQQVIAKLPMSSLYEGQEDYLALTAYGESAWICSVTDAGTAACSISFYELQYRDGIISVAQSFNAAEMLGFLFDAAEKWKEIDMMGCRQGIYIAAMDEAWNYQMFVFQPATGELLSIGSQPFSGYNAVFPMGDGLLLIGSNEEEEGTEELIRISLPDGGREILRSMQTSAFVQPAGYAFSEEKQMVYYFLNGTGFRVGVSGDAQPEPFCTVPENAALLRCGAVSGGYYILLDADGELIFRDAEGTVTAESFRILDLTGAETLEDAIAGFNARFPNTLVVLASGDEEDKVLDAVLSQSTDYDAFAVSLGSGLYQTMRARGYLGSMNGSEILRAAADAMPAQIRNAVMNGGQLTAFPVYVTNATLALNVPAVMNLTGLAEDQIPGDWAGFLQLLCRIGEQGLMEDKPYTLLGEGLNARTIQGTFFSWIMQDLMLWLSQDETRINEMQFVLLPVLQSFEKVPWDVFGQEDSRDLAGDEETETLLIMAEPEIAVMALDPGIAYWPLSLAPGGEKLTGQVVDALVLNPYSMHADAVIRYAETVWEQMDIVIRMELDTTLNEPVINQTFEEDVAFFEQQISLYEAALAQSENEKEKAELQENLAELKKFVEGYRENAGWIVSEDSIAFYRALESMQVLQADEFWSEGAEDAAVFQFLDGMLPAAQFVEQLAFAMQMSRMEGD